MNIPMLTDNGSKKLCTDISIRHIVNMVMAEEKERSKWENYLIGIEKCSKKHIIDCDAEPFIPNNLEIKEHKKGGHLEWDPKRIGLYLSKEQ